MLILLSPAKKQTPHLPPLSMNVSLPQFIAQSDQLMDTLKTFTPETIGQLMNVSPSLAKLNHQRFQSYSREQLEQHGTPCLSTFQGDAYQSLDVSTLSESALIFANQHLFILSGLYGLLRPFDAILPYRLEMKTRLQIDRIPNLYAFWTQQLTTALIQHTSKQPTPLVIDLASQEYGKAIADTPALNRVRVKFLEQKSGQLKSIGLYAKRARGLMTRYIIEHEIKTLDHLYDFSYDGYQYDSKRSKSNHLVFIRDHD